MIIPKAYQRWAEFKTGTPYDPLTDVKDITVTEEMNGIFDLDMEYPESGENASTIHPAGAGINGTVIQVPPRAGAQAEPFYVYEVTRSLNRIMRVKAHHAVYRLTGNVIDPFKTTGITATIAKINTELNDGNYYFINIDLSDETTEFENEKVSTAWELVGKIANTFGGEMSYRYDYISGYIRIEYRQARGSANAITIREGVNIVSYENTFNTEERTIAVCGYWTGDDGNGNKVTVTATRSTHILGEGRILIVDMTDRFESMPSAADLDTEVQAYANGMTWYEKNGTETLSVDFVLLGTTTEYDESIALDLGDTVTVRVLKDDVTARIVKYEYNPYIEKYKTISIGSKPVNIADTIASMSAAMNQ